MKKRKLYSDRRLDLMCSYCGEQPPQTRDHVPSKILLDEPYPEDLPVVPCCIKCNQDFSMDEEYFACFIECALHGTAEVDKLKRGKIKAILLRKEPLRKRMENAFVENDGKKFIKLEEDRVQSVLIKLAKGHLKFENSEPIYDAPSYMWIGVLSSLTANEYEYFLEPPALNLLPEVGSRSLQELFINVDNKVYSSWKVVQDEAYRYLVVIDHGFLSVKIILWESIAIEVRWVS